MSGLLESSLVSRGSVSTAVDDESVAYELFRRAICERDDAAWYDIVERYERLVRSWVRQYNSAADPADEAGFVNRAFVRFWQAQRPEKFARFKDLSSLLAYLKSCASTVVLDDRRSAQRHPTISLDGLMGDSVFQGPSAPDDPSGEVDNRAAGGLAWATIERVLPAAEDRLLARLSFVEGLPPAAISQRYPHVFPSAQDVYRRKALVIDRLRRSPLIQALVD